MQRPSPAALESAYDALFQSPYDKLVDSALYGRLFIDRFKEDNVAGRSMAWKLFLLPQPPLTASLNPHATPPIEAVRSGRERYISLLKDRMRAPDGSYEEGLRIPGGFTPPVSTAKKPDDWNLNNPLSLDSSNPWHAYFSAIEARNVIRQDVERTFPELPYFRSTIVQDEMTNILFVHTSGREDVGYRQGMHELLACIYRVVDYDSVQAGECPERYDLEALCDRAYVAADAFALFTYIMQRIEIWYEWRPPSVATPQTPRFPHFSAEGELVPSNGQIKPYVAPIIPISTSIRDEKLRKVDPLLFEKLRETNIEPQMYGMRWLRLLFTREFSLTESMVLWDGLFASVAADSSSPSSSSSRDGFELAHWICVAMLIRIRNSLIPGDYTDQLTVLLRYPSLSALGSSSTWNTPEVLLNQAQLLILSPTPASGVSVVMQNRYELNIPVEVPEPPVRQSSRRRPTAGSPITSSSVPAIVRPQHTQERPRIQDVIASRIMDANETYGIQKGFLSTISEIRKNLPELPQSLMRNPSSTGSNISLAEERGDGSLRRAASSPEIDERPPWEPRARSEVEAEVAELRGLLKKLGDTIGWAVDVLLQDEGGTKDNSKPLAERKREALECMSYVRDVLNQGGRGVIEEERLFGEEEYKRRKQRNAAPSLSVPQQPKPVVHPPPHVVPKPEDKAKHHGPSASFSGKEPFTPVVSLPRTPLTQAPPDPLIRFSSRPNPSFYLPSSNHAPSESQPKRVAPPWEHTPSNFSADTPYTRASLPRPPPPLRTVSSSSSETPPDNPKSDPLGVQILR
ncbi:hypothetical protein M422DRAFT_252206 [Sphaerobolus stellatus SS14]|uniref:Rab-GAP TBC domain-containing protein n=1 Tax=Sphaerobolus stellatus (strain SS14) TaxID=990650 RepID=A0A0C9VYS8_SPHS4|nr:hypothetical protein M422DRAFT_252206 [Sphaerobolus stellatus SS14]